MAGCKEYIRKYGLWGLCGVIAIIVSPFLFREFIFKILFFKDVESTTAYYEIIRNIALGLVAFIGLIIGGWRAKVANDSNKIANDNYKLEQEKLKQENKKICMEQDKIRYDIQQPIVSEIWECIVDVKTHLMNLDTQINNKLYDKRKEEKAWKKCQDVANTLIETYAKKKIYLLPNYIKKMEGLMHTIKSLYEALGSGANDEKRQKLLVKLPVEIEKLTKDLEKITQDILLKHIQNSDSSKNTQTEKAL